MSSPRQIEANRLNALKSTGPTSANGKHVSRRNALRHGLTAETVMEPLEDPEEYRIFEAAIVAEYMPQTPVERELVHRLASLFWRMRRATSIETGLLRMQSENLQAFRSSRQKTIDTRGEGTSISFAEGDLESRQELAPSSNGTHELGPNGDRGPAASTSRDIALSYLRLANLDNDGTHELGPNGDRGPAASTSRDIALSYLRLANLDNELIDRLSRYEASLWRQVVQTLFTLQTLKRR